MTHEEYIKRRDEIFTNLEKHHRLLNVPEATNLEQTKTAIDNLVLDVIGEDTPLPKLEETKPNELTEANLINAKRQLEYQGSGAIEEDRPRHRQRSIVRGKE